MKIALVIVLGLVLIFIGIRVFQFIGDERQLGASLDDVQNRLAQAKTQEADLQEQMQYLSNPANLEKELRTQFNYKNPGETMIIIVPTQSSTTP